MKRFSGNEGDLVVMFCNSTSTRNSFPPLLLCAKFHQNCKGTYGSFEH